MGGDGGVRRGEEEGGGGGGGGERRGREERWGERSRAECCLMDNVLMNESNMRGRKVLCMII